MRKKTKKTVTLSGRTKKVKKTQKKARRKAPKQENIKRIRVQVIGIGGGGGSIVAEIAQKIKGASFVVANSDLKALSGFPRTIKKFHFGYHLTGGLGTGMDPVVGEEAAKAEKDRIKEMMEGQDLVIFISCLGGGLGSGAGPVFAKVAKSMGVLSYGIFTIPFKFEGEKKMQIARESLKKLEQSLNAFSVIPNQKIFKIIDKSEPLKKALSAINKTLAEGLGGLIDIIYKPGVINIDFADLRTVLEGRGKLAYLNSVDLGKNDDNGIVDKVINSPLYPYSINGAKGVIINISGQKDLSLTQVNDISKTIYSKAYRRAKIIFGVSKAGSVSKIRVFLLATGCDSKIFQKESKAKPKKRIKPAPKPSIKIKEKRKKKVKKIKVKDSSLEEARIVGNKSSDIIKPKGRVRKSAVQIKKDVENEEAEIISREKSWDTPTFLRKGITR